LLVTVLAEKKSIKQHACEIKLALMWQHVKAQIIIQLFIASIDYSGNSIEVWHAISFNCPIM